jgi:hypothetical protein
LGPLIDDAASVSWRSGELFHGDFYVFDLDIRDTALSVMAHEDGLVLTAPGGETFAVTVRAAEESAARLLAAVATERARRGETSPNAR